MGGRLTVSSRAVAGRLHLLPGRRESSEAGALERMCMCGRGGRGCVCVLRALRLRRSAQNPLQQTSETRDLLLHGLHSLPADSGRQNSPSAPVLQTRSALVATATLLPGLLLRVGRDRWCLPGLRLVPQQRRAEPPRAPSLSSGNGHQAELLRGETQPWTLTPGFRTVPEHGGADRVPSQTLPPG